MSVRRPLALWVTAALATASSLRLFFGSEREVVTLLPGWPALWALARGDVGLLLAGGAATVLIGTMFVFSGGLLFTVPGLVMLVGGLIGHLIESRASRR